MNIRHMIREEEKMPENRKGPARRDVLRLTALGLAAGAAGLAMKGHEAEAQADGEHAAGYRETDHVRRYYELAKF